MLLFILQLVLRNLLHAYCIIIGIDVLLSWIPGSYQYKIPRLIHTVSDWYLGLFHDILIIGPINFTPILAIGVIEFLLYFCYI